MKKLIVTTFYFIIILYSIGFTQETDCKLHINILQPDSVKSIYIVSRNNILYEDTIGIKEDSICLLVKEPIKSLIIINEDINLLIPFYLHEGDFSVTINYLDKSYFFSNSILNEEYKKLNDIDDSIRNLFGIPNRKKLIDLIFVGLDDSLKSKIDTYEKTLDEVHYNYFLQNPNSFLSLNFIYLGTYCKYYNIDKERLKFLFSKLDKTFENNIYYKECVNYFSNEDKPIDIVPLWNQK